MYNNLIDLLIMILPIFSITLTANKFPIDISIYKPVFQPPKWVFPIVWTYILLSLGIITNTALFKAENKLLIYSIYSILVILLNIWLIINYYKYYKIGFYILIITTYISIIYCILLSNHGNNIYYLIPMPFWLVIASCLNSVIYDRITMFY